MTERSKPAIAIYMNQSGSPEDPKVIEVVLGYFLTLAEAQRAALNAKQPKEGTPLVQIRYGGKTIGMT
jgi:hypothetical protein